MSYIPGDRDRLRGDMDEGGPATGGGRILLIDDDRSFGAWVRHVLAGSAFEITHVLDPREALKSVAAGSWDLVISDIEMPGITGLELLDQIRQIEPTLPVAIATAHATVDWAVSATGHLAVEFIQKPIRPAEFAAKVAELVERGQIARAACSGSVLAIGAHPDDVETGAAGTLLAHRAAGDDLAILTLSRGAPGGLRAERLMKSEHAAQVIGARLYLGDLEDSRIAEGNPTIGIIERVVAEVRPTVVYTHSPHDAHSDHRNTYHAALVAARGVGRLLCFQSPSATADFRPTRFVTIDDYVAGKLQATEAFGAQSSVRDYLEPDVIAATARHWSRFCDGDQAEAFEVVRDRPATR